MRSGRFFAGVLLAGVAVAGCKKDECQGGATLRSASRLASGAPSAQYYRIGFRAVRTR